MVILLQHPGRRIIIGSGRLNLEGPRRQREVANGADHIADLILLALHIVADRGGNRHTRRPTRIRAVLIEPHADTQCKNSDGERSDSACDASNSVPPRHARPHLHVPQLPHDSPRQIRGFALVPVQAKEIEFLSRRNLVAMI